MCHCHMYMGDGYLHGFVRLGLRCKMLSMCCHETPMHLGKQGRGMCWLSIDTNTRHYPAHTAGIS